MGSITVIQRICFGKFLWNNSEGLCDINLKGTVYLYFSVLHIVLFFFIIVNKNCE